MKIVDIEAIHLRIEDPAIGLFDGSYDDCVIVVRTDDGRVGIGEVESLPSAIQGIVHAPPAHNHARGLRELLLGEDPTDPERLWQLMYDATDYVGRRGLMMHAIGGVDIALWDLAGQAAGKPICELLGGKKRDRLLAYGTIYPMAKTPEAVATQIEDARAMGLRAFKFAADPWWMDDLALTARLLHAARAAMGPDALFIVDAALAYPDVAAGKRLVPILKDVGVYFLEAPLPLDDVAGHAQMAALGIPLGVGDLGLTHVDEFIEMMDRGGAAICQPDITMVGGFTGLKKIAAAATARGKRVITHGYKTNIEIAANLHFLASHVDAELLEFSTSRSPLRWKTTRESLPIEEDGRVRVPDRPGLGVTLDDGFVAAHRWRTPATLAALLMFFAFLGNARAQEIPQKVADPPGKTYTYGNMPHDGKPHAMDVSQDPNLTSVVLVRLPLFADARPWLGNFARAGGDLTGKGRLWGLADKRVYKDGTKGTRLYVVLEVEAANRARRSGSTTLEGPQIAPLVKALDQGLAAVRGWKGKPREEVVSKLLGTSGKSVALTVSAFQAAAGAPAGIRLRSAHNNVAVSTTRREDLELLRRQVRRLVAWLERSR